MGVNNIVQSVNEGISYIFETHKNDIITLSYSGGKDSTLLLVLVSKFLTQHRKKFKDTFVYFIYSDTGVEIPEIREFPVRILKETERFFKSLNMKVYARIVKPSPQNNFFIKMLMGYPMPHIRFRWCTRVLKTKPIDDFIKKLKIRHKGKKIVKIIGVRAEESQSRRSKRGVYETSFFEIKNKEVPIYAPIYNLTSNQVWKILEEMINKVPFWSKKEFSYLRRIYGKKMTIRHGCWICPLISLKSGDKALRELAESLNERYLLELEKIKKELIEISFNKENRTIDEKTKKPRSLNEKGKKEIIKLIEKMRKSPKLKKALYGLLEDEEVLKLYLKIKKRLC